VVVHAHAAGVTALGYTYADVSTAKLSSEIGDAWQAALSADRPVIISALTDPNEAPLPAHITFQQAQGFAKSIEKDPTSSIGGRDRTAARKSPRIPAGTVNLAISPQ
jgi:hypothetical protein